MKIFFLFLLFLVILSSNGAPIDKSSFPPSAQPFISREHFETILRLVRPMMNNIGDSMVPYEISDFLKNITADDYDAIKYLHTLGAKIMSSQIDGHTMYEMVMTFQRDYADFNDRMQSAVLGLFRRIGHLSKSTKLLLANQYFLSTHLRKTGDKDRAMKIVTYYMSWPKENREELEQIFPKLSEKASVLKRLSNHKETEYPSELPDCTTNEEMPEKCSAFIDMMNFNLFLDKDADQEMTEEDMEKAVNNSLRKLVEESLQMYQPPVNFGGPAVAQSA